MSEQQDKPFVLNAAEHDLRWLTALTNDQREEVRRIVREETIATLDRYFEFDDQNSGYTILVVIRFNPEDKDAIKAAKYLASLSEWEPVWRPIPGLEKTSVTIYFHPGMHESLDKANALAKRIPECFLGGVKSVYYA
jgi:hypothetical protein